MSSWDNRTHTEIEVGGTVIRLRGPVDTEQFKAVLAVVRA